MLRMAETSLDTAVEPLACPSLVCAMAATAEGGSGLMLGNVALEDLGLWFMQAWGSVGCEPV